ncbi:MAG: AraC family transcriptional regulator [Defluviitaleaceae bacterium]|nr:AraC family transcriptional regulator [Defluviitaleaceae bacterium]
MSVNVNSLLIEALASISEKMEYTSESLLPISIYSNPAPATEAKIYASPKYAYIEKETHDFYEVAIVLKGKVVFMMEGEYYPVSENQIMIIDKEINHANGWLKTEDENALILWINVVEFKLRIHTTAYANERKYDSGMDIVGLDKSLIEAIIKELKTKKEGYEKAVFLYIKTFLTLIYRRIESNTINTGSIWSQLLVNEIEQYISEHLYSKITLQKISKNLAVSPNYLSLIFKQVRGRNLLDYIHEMKINKAKPLLNTSQTLSEIAQHFGFYDQFHFSKVFKKYMKISPSQYRKLLSDGGSEPRV